MGYDYRPLCEDEKEIRILRWLPPNDNDDDEVRCELVHQSLDQNPDYDALSYTWGDPEPAQLIYVAGAPVSITPNLYGALRQLRHANRNLWVDSLCINQKDDHERSSQVSLMGNIYKKADIVIMWLGEEEDDSDIAMNFLEIFKDELLSRSGDSGFMMRDTAFDRTWVAVGKLFQRPYWGRLWIIQEAILARNPVLCCGAGSCAWDFIQLLLLQLNARAMTQLSTAAREALLFPSSDLPRTSARLYDQRFNGTQMSLVDCLVLGRQRQTTEARDHIYGVLSLVDNPAIEPDYSISTNTLYRNVVEHMIEKDQNLDILSACIVKEIKEIQIFAVL